MTNFFKNLFLYSVGHTYSNLSRLFLRLFTGIMFLQLCIRQMLSFDEIVHSFDGFLGLSPESAMTVLLVVELLCAVCIMLGFLTRLAVLFPMGLMLVAENVLLPQTSVTDPMFSFLPDMTGSSSAIFMD